MKKYTVPEVLAELKKVRIIEMSNGKHLCTEITKKQRTLCSTFGIPDPGTPGY